MKTKLLISLLALACLALTGCFRAPAISLFPSTSTGADTPAKPPASAVPAAQAIATADAHTERVTLDGLNVISTAFFDVRQLARDSRNYVEISRTLDSGVSAVTSIRTEIKAHPSAVVGKAIAKQAAQIDAANAPSTKIEIIGYGGGIACLVLCVLVVFASGWLKTIPVVGPFLVDNIGSHLQTILAALGAGLISATWFYAWTCHHPVITTVLKVLTVTGVVTFYVNTYDSGLFGRVKAWFASQLPRVKHTAQAIEADALSLENRIAAGVQAELAKLHKPAVPPTAT